MSLKRQNKCDGSDYQSERELDLATKSAALPACLHSLASEIQLLISTSDHPCGCGTSLNTNCGFSAPGLLNPHRKLRLYRSKVI